MTKSMDIHWSGPGYYLSDGDAAYRITTDNLEEAEALATLAGLNIDTLVELKNKPQSSGFIFVIDETKDAK